MTPSPPYGRLGGHRACYSDPFARAGADAIVADVDAKGADDTVSQIRAAGRQGRFVHTDLGSGGADPLGQFEIFERGRIAERNQDGAANLRRVGTVRSVRLDIPLRAWWI